MDGTLPIGNVFVDRGCFWSYVPVRELFIMKNIEQLGRSVREHRKKLGVTQKELAMVCGTGLRFIVDLERGKPTCHIGKVLQVLQALGLTLSLNESDAGGVL